MSEGECEKRLARCNEQLRAAEELSAQRKKENDELREELNSVRSSLMERQEQTRELESKLNQQIAERTVERIELHRLKQEIDIAKNHTEWQKQDYERRLQESQDAWKSCSKKLSENEIQLSKVTSDRGNFELRLRAAEQEKRLLEDQLLHARNAQQQLQVDLQNVERDRDREMASCRTLVARCKAVEDEANREKERAMELVAAAEQNVEKLKSEFTEEKKRLDAEFTAKLDEATRQKSNLELSHAYVSTLAPAAAEEMLKARGLTLSGLYTELVDEKEKSRQQEEEIQRLNMYLNKIVEEVETAAPELINARLQYSRVLADAEALNENVKALLDENAQLKSELSLQSDKLEEVSKENRELALEAEDLATQVRTLLTQSEDKRSAFETSGVSFTSPPRAPRSDYRTGEEGEGGENAQETISENLVQYHNVQELQERNQQLLRLVRRLADEAERGVDNSDSAEKLRQAEEEMKRMSEARERQEGMITAIVRQRDLYRSLLNQADSKHLQQQQQQLVATSSSSTSTTSLALVPQQSAESFQADFEIYRKETQDQLKELSKSLDDTKIALHETKLKLVHAVAERDFQLQRFEQFTSVFESTKKEAERLSAANQESTAQLLRAHALLDEKSRELGNMESTVKRLEYEKSSVNAEKTVLAGEREHLSQHIESLTKQRDAQRDIASQWEQALKDLTARYQQEKQDRDRLEKAFAEASTDAKEARKEKDAALARLEREKSELSSRLSSFVEESQKVKENLTKAETELDVLRRTEHALKEQLERALVAPKTSSSGTTSDPTTSSSSFGLFQDLRAEIERWKRDVEQKTKDLEALRAISLENDKTMKLLQETNTKLKNEHEERAREFAEERSTLKAEMDKSHRDLERERGLVSDLRKELDAAKSQLQMVESLQRRVSQAEEDVKRFQSELSIANENYSRELQLHASDVSQVSEMRKELDRVRKQLDDSSRQISELNSQLKSRTSELQNERTAFDLKLKQREAELEDFRRENQLMLQQLSSQSALTTSAASSSTTTSVDENQMTKYKEMFEIASRGREKVALEKEELVLELKRASSQLEQAKMDLERCREELKRVEHANTSSQDRQKLQLALQENQVLRSFNTSHAEELSRTKDELERTKVELSSSRDSVLQVRKQEQELRSKVELSEQDVAAKAREIKLLKDRLTGVLNRIGNAEILEKLKQENGTVTAERDELKKQIERTQTQMNSLRAGGEQQRQELSRQVTALQGELSKSQQKIASVEREKDESLKKVKSETEKEREEEVKTLKSELDEKNRSLQDKEKSLENKQTFLTKFRAKIEELNTKLKETEQKLKECEAKLKECEDSKAAKQSAEPVSTTNARKRTKSSTSEPGESASEETKANPIIPIMLPTPDTLAVGGMDETTTPLSGIVTPPPPPTVSSSTTPSEAPIQPTAPVSVTAPPTKEEQPALQEQPQPSPASPKVEEPATSSTTTPSPPRAPLDLDSLSEKTMKRVLQRLKIPFANQSKQEMLASLKQFASTNGVESIRKFVEEGPTAKTPPPQVAAAVKGAPVPAGTKSKQPQQPPTEEEKAMLQKKLDELKRKQQQQQQQRATAVTSTSSTTSTALQPETLPPPPVDVPMVSSSTETSALPSASAAPSATAPPTAASVDNIAAMKAARAARFGVAPAGSAPATTESTFGSAVGLVSSKRKRSMGEETAGASSGGKVEPASKQLKDDTSASSSSSATEQQQQSSSAPAEEETKKPQDPQ